MCSPDVSSNGVLLCLVEFINFLWCLIRSHVSYNILWYLMELFLAGDEQITSQFTFIHAAAIDSVVTIHLSERKCLDGVPCHLSSYEINDDITLNGHWSWSSHSPLVRVA